MIRKITTDSASRAHKLGREMREGFEKQFSTFYEQDDDHFNPIFCTAAFLDPTFRLCVHTKYDPKIKEYLKGKYLYFCVLIKSVFYQEGSITLNYRPASNSHCLYLK